MGIPSRYNTTSAHCNVLSEQSTKDMESPAGLFWQEEGRDSKINLFLYLFKKRESMSSPWSTFRNCTMARVTHIKTITSSSDQPNILLASTGSTEHDSINGIHVYCTNLIVEANRFVDKLF